jgi:anthraniloyl-CoA monooxygenase
MAPVQFTYSLMTRSLRVSHASVAKRDPHLARGVERLLAASVGVASDPPPPPTALPFVLGDRRARSRIAVCPHGVAGEPPATDATRPVGVAREPAPPDARPAFDAATESPAPDARRAFDAAGESQAPDARRSVDAASDATLGDAELDHELVALGGAALAGAGLVVTAGLPLDAGAPWRPSLADDEGAVAWRRVVDYVHGRGALIVARLDLRDRLRDGLRQTLPNAPRGALFASVQRAARFASVQRAAFAGFDMILLDPCGDAAAIEELPSAIADARAAWRTGGWIAAAIHDRPTSRAAVIGNAAQVVRAGADLLWVSAPGDSPPTHGARLPAAPLADRLRNELGVATAIEGGSAVLPDLDAAIAAGRADLVVAARLPDGARRAP